MKPASLLPRYLIVTTIVVSMGIGLSALLLFSAWRSSIEDFRLNQVIVVERQQMELAALAADLSPLLAAGENVEALTALEASGLQAALVDAEGKHLGGLRLPESEPVLSQPVLDGDRVLATLRVPASASVADLTASDTLREGMWRFAWLALAILLTTLSAAAVLASRHSRSIRRLTRSAEQMGDGDFQNPLAVGLKDDFRQLSRALNDMRRKLKDTTVSRDHLDSILASMKDAVIVVDAEGEIVSANSAAGDLLGVDSPTLTGQVLADHIAPAGRDRFDPCKPTNIPLETEVLTRDGVAVPISYTSSVVRGGASDQYIVSARNISERRSAERRIMYLARTDPLTNLPNRRHFLAQFEKLVGGREDQQWVFFYLDVDRFKDVNDIWGHTVGDEVLRKLAGRLRNELSSDERVGRLGGDEFAILSPVPEGSTATDYARERGSEILACIGEQTRAEGTALSLSGCTGAAIYPDDGETVADLMKNADAALLHAKKDGAGEVRVYEGAMNEALTERLLLKNRLQQAYENDELRLRYQPKYDARSGLICGAEALVRWELPDHGLVLPSKFIPLAEESGIILEIGEWVLNRTCSDLALWQDLLPDDWVVAANLSLLQLRQPQFVEQVQEIMQRHGIRPAMLELEITETTLMSEVERSVRLLQDLRDTGLKLAIDDFGTGYSSLSALQQFPISTLKIDRSFVRNAVSSGEHRKLLTTLIDMGSNLSLGIVVEGVENAEQLALLRETSCDQVQGHLFGDPVTAQELLELLKAQQRGELAHRALFPDAA